MNVVYLLDPKTQVGYALKSFAISSEALNYKARLQVDHPASLFYHTLNRAEPEFFFTFEEAFAIING